MKNKKNLAIALSLSLLLVLSLANIAVSYLAGHPFQGHLFTSDALYLPTLMADLLAHGGRMADWFLTPAPYLFPDYPLFVLAYWLGLDAYGQIVIFSLIQTVVTCGVIWFLAREVAPARPLVAAVAASIALVWLALNSADSFFTSLANAFHYGIFLCALVFIALWLRRDRTEQARTRTVMLLAMSALAFLSTLSDKLFLVQVIAPFIATALLVDFANRDFSFKSKRVLLIPALAAGLGSASYRYIVHNKTRYPTDMGVEKAFSNLADLCGVFYRAVADSPIYAVVLVLYLGIVFHCCRDLMRKPEARTVPKPMAWLALFSLMSLCASVVALTFLTNFAIVARYLIPGLSLPVILVVLFSSQLLGRRFAAVATAASFVAVASMSIGSYRLAAAHGLSDGHYPSEVACIDGALKAAGLNNGIAQYWDAKYLQNFSKLDLNIAQHYGNLDEMRWITTKRYFKDRYDFAVVSENAEPLYKLSVEKLSGINGPAEQVVHCGSRTVHIYGKDKLRVK